MIANNADRDAASNLSLHCLLTSDFRQKKFESTILTVVHVSQSHAACTGSCRLLGRVDPEECLIVLTNDWPK